jgi:hypothetical protein
VVWPLWAIQSVPEVHAIVLRALNRPFLKLMKAPSEQLSYNSEVRRTSIIRKKQKEVHMPVMGFKPRIFYFLVSDAPTGSNCSHDLKMYHSTLSWKYHENIIVFFYLNANSISKT